MGRFVKYCTGAARPTHPPPYGEKLLPVAWLRGLDDTADRPGGYIRPEHLAPTATAGTAAISCVTTANVAAFATLVIGLTVGQSCPAGRRPPKIAIVPYFRITWLEYQDRAPRNIVNPLDIAKTQPQSNSNSDRFQVECNVRAAIAPWPRHEIRRNRLLSAPLIAPAQRSK